MVILLTGTDSYRMSQRADFLREAFLKKFVAQNPITRAYSGSSIDIHEFRASTHTLGLFPQKTCVLLTHAEDVALDLREKFETLFDTVAEDVIVIITYTPPQKKGAWTTLKNHVTKEEVYGSLEPSELRTWIREQTKMYSLTLTSAQIERLIATTAGDLWTLSHIIHQLSHAERPLTAENLELFLPEKDAGSIFVLIDAIAQKKLGASLAAVDKQLEHGNSVHALLTLIGKHLGLLHHVLATPEKPIDVHPYALKKAQAQSRGFTIPRLRALLAELLTIDQQLKSTSVDERALLFLFCTHACQ